MGSNSALPTTARAFATGGKRKTAGIIVIGDEILNGSTTDTNSSFLCRRLHHRGVLVKKITVVGDTIPEIAADVAEFSRNYDLVLTTGGVGPTHDDRTYEAIAAAFGDTLRIDDDLQAVFEDVLSKYKQRPDTAQAIQKFCSIPSSATLLPTTSSHFRACPTSVNPATINSRTPSSRSLTHRLGDIAKAHAAEGVSIGSYPVVGNSYYKTKLTVEATTKQAGQTAYAELGSSFREFVRNFDELPWVDTVKKMDAFRAGKDSHIDAAFLKKLNDALELIELELGRYPLEQVALSFNGGKDCTILLHLLRVVIDKLYGPETKIKAFHILCEDEFPELRRFVLDIAWKYNVQLRELGGSLKSGLQTLQADEPDVKVVFMGSRSTDPHGKFMKSKCQWTDEDWPQFYRVCPVFDWSYAEVWKGLRGLCVPYCILYDRGYTSLGDRSKTVQNAALRIAGDQYKPAYCLEEDHLEREGRDKDHLITVDSDVYLSKDVKTENGDNTKA
uniref:FAD synthase n=1 Tax=Panagrellus redivivus TaxID=6233 RepID=A0A7E4V467_PANRE